MSSILLKWINEDIGLSRRVTSFEEDFKNGYLLAEILWRSHHQPDFEYSFQDSTDSNAIVNNYCRLEPTLRGLNVRKFNSRVAQLVINGHREVTIELLYNIKMALRKVKGRTGSCKLKQQSGSSTNSMLPVRMTRPRFDVATSLHFQKALHSMAENQSAINIARHLRKFDLQGKKLHQNALKLEATEREALDAYVAEVRRQRIQRTKAEHEYVQEWQEKGIGIWLENQRIQRGREELRHNYNLLKQKKKHKRVDQERSKAAYEVREGMMHMKQKLISLGIRTEATSILDQEDGEDEDGLLDDCASESIANIPPTGTSFHELLSTMNSGDQRDDNPDEHLDDSFEEEMYNQMLQHGDAQPPLPQQDSRETAIATDISISKLENTAEFSNLMKELRGRHTNRRVQAKMRASRRKSFLSQLQKRDTEKQIQMVSELREFRNSHQQTVGEHELCTMVEQQLVFSDVIEENRIFREKEYRKENEKHSVLVEKRQREVLDGMKTVHQEMVQRQLNELTALQVASSTKKSHDALELCRDVVLAAVELAMLKHKLDLVYTGPCDEQAWIDVRSTLAFPDLNFSEYEYDNYRRYSGRWKTPESVKVVLPPSQLDNFTVIPSENDDENADLEAKEGSAPASKKKGKSTKAGVNETDEIDAENAPVVVRISQESVEDACQGTFTGDSIMDMMKLLHPPKPGEPKPTSIPRFLVSAIVFGPPCCGKTALVHALAEKHNLNVVDPFQLVAELLDNYKQNPDALSRSQSDMIENISKGGAVNDEWYVALIVERVKQLEALRQDQVTQNTQNLQRMEELHLSLEESASNSNHDDVKRKATEFLFKEWDKESRGYLEVKDFVLACKNYAETCNEEINEDLIGRATLLLQQFDSNLDGKVALEDLWSYMSVVFGSLSVSDFCTFVIDILKKTCVQKPIQGWILDGFPWTLKQADLLEQSLGGIYALEQPRQLPPLSCFPYTLIPPLDESRLLNRSYFDCVFRIDANDEYVLNRALGDRTIMVSEKSSEHAHVAFAPPTAVDTSQCGGIVKIPDQVFFRERVLAPRLFDFRKHEEKLSTFFEAFGNLTALSLKLQDCFGTGSLLPETSCKPPSYSLYSTDEPTLSTADKLVQTVVSTKLKNLEKAEQDAERLRRKDIISTLSEAWWENVAVDQTELESPIAVPEGGGSDTKPVLPKFVPLNTTTISLCWPEWKENISWDSNKFFEALCEPWVDPVAVNSEEFETQINTTMEAMKEFRNSKVGALAVVIRDWFLSIEQICKLSDETQLVDDEEGGKPLDSSTKTVLSVPVNMMDSVICEFATLLQNCLIVHELLDQEEGAPELTDEVRVVVGELDINTESLEGLKSYKLPTFVGKPIEETEDEENEAEIDGNTEERVEVIDEAEALLQLTNEDLAMESIKTLVVILRKAIEDSYSKQEAEIQANQKKKKPKSPDKAQKKATSTEAEEIGQPEPVDIRNNEVFEILTSCVYQEDSSMKDCLVEVFSDLRKLRDEQASYFVKLRDHFREFINTGDTKQGILEEFQLNFNTVPLDMRYDTDTKCELHLRTDFFREKLWKVIEQKNHFGKLEIEEITNDGWLESYQSRTVCILLWLMQQETHFYQSVRSVIVASNSIQNIGEIQVETLSEFISNGHESVLVSEYILPVALDEIFEGDNSGSKTAAKESKPGKPGKGGNKSSNPSDGVVELHSADRLGRAHQFSIQLVNRFQSSDSYHSIELVEHDVRYLRNIAAIFEVGQRLIEEAKTRFTQHISMLEAQLEDRILNELLKLEQLVGYIRRSIECSVPLQDDIYLSGEELVISQGVSKPQVYAREDLELEGENQEAPLDL